jgi:hypothetical protein
MSTEIIMRKIKAVLLAGVAALGLAGFAGQAEARSPEIHVMTVQLPGGGVSEIRYTGNVAPQVVLAPVPVTVGSFAPACPFFWSDSPFEILDRISLQMDRQIANLLHAQAMALQPLPAPDRLTEVALGRMPPGSTSYSFLATASNDGVCTREVRITSVAGETRPRVVSTTSGSCGAQPGGAVNAGIPAEARTRTMSVKDEVAPAPARPGNGLLHWTSWQRG